MLVIKNLYSCFTFRCTFYDSTLNNIFIGFRRLRRPKFEMSSDRVESDESEYRYNQKPYDRDGSISDYYYDDYSKYKLMK